MLEENDSAGLAFLMLVPFEGVPYRLVEPIATKPVVEVNTAAAGYAGRSSIISGSCRLEGGGGYMFMFDWSVLMTPMEGNLRQLEYIFIKRIPTTIMG